MIQFIGKDLKYSLQEREKFLNRLFALPDGHVLLQTCNRVELYWGDGFASTKIVRHLFRVVSGLESALIGETAIQGQVKQAYLKAKENNCLSSGLHRLFQNALRVGKRVRTETGISEGALSHSLAVLEILQQEQIEIAASRFLIIGVNRLNTAVIQYLLKKGSRAIFVANRAFKKAQNLSRQFNCEAVRFDVLYQTLSQTDVVISATSAPHLIIHKDRFPHHKQMILFDLAVPRDVDPALADLQNISLYNIEAIENRITNNERCRQNEILRAEKIIHEEIEKYLFN